MLGKKKKMLQVSITKEHYEALDYLVRTGPKTRSQIVEDALTILFGFINGQVEVNQTEEIENVEGEK